MHTALLNREQFVKNLPELITMFDINPSMTIRIEYPYTSSITKSPTISKVDKEKALCAEYDTALSAYKSGKTRVLATF